MEVVLNMWFNQDRDQCNRVLTHSYTSKRTRSKVELVFYLLQCQDVLLLNVAKVDIFFHLLFFSICFTFEHCATLVCVTTITM